MALGLFHYQVLSDVLKKIHYVHDETEISRIILEQLSKVLSTEGGTVFKIYPGDKLTPIAAFGADLERLRQLDYEFGKGIVGWVASHREAIKVDDTASDPRFSRAADLVTGIRTKTIIATPIFSKGEIVGVLEFVNKKGGIFTQSDLELTSMLGRELGAAFESVGLIKDIEESRAYLKSIVDSLSAGLVVIDKEKNIPIINRRAAQILKIEKNGLQDPKRPLAELQTQLPDFFTLLKALSESGQAVPRAQEKIKINGSEMVVGYSTVPITDEKGGYSGMTVLFQDITTYSVKP